MATKEDLLTKTVNRNGVFVNSDISLKHIDVYGFDYDYTLVRYTSEVHRLIYDHAKNMLVDKFMVSDDCMFMKILVIWTGTLRVPGPGTPKC